MYGMGQSPESNFVRLAEGKHNKLGKIIYFCLESSRNAFQSIEAVVSAVASVANMLNSTHNAVFSSFRAVIGVVEQFSILKKQVSILIWKIRTLFLVCRRRHVHNSKMDKAFLASSDGASGLETGELCKFGGCLDRCY
jgi:hypothetical protein